ncbi:HEAT repeat-containing protein [Halogranum amylolyticum]|uniref:HEAT repeat-containing protein n=1 Tax=Halogranum amylolyticum TaxID=660520 RepID=A0A1H8P0E3_9EURY|nr:HEAT repeat domain-containing protein [Halogranum amylolyticum]SEO35038.1 HEAT repeat-containing protein [Halogranum amylolyticum]
MSDGDDAPEDSGAAEDEISAESLEERLSAAEADLEAAETEDDLDDVEAELDDIESDLEAADLPEPDEDEDDEENVREELEGTLSDLREELEAQRGPYAADVVEMVEEAETKISDTRWTERGETEIVTAVESFVDSVNNILDTSVSVDGTDESALTAALDDAVAAIEAADLDADDDAETIATLVEAADDLESDLDDAQEWDDLETREQLQVQGFYDVLGHYKDYPPEWSAVKGWEQEGNVEMVLLALESFQSDFMEENCLESIIRMNDQAAFDAMHQRAQKRNKPAIKALGKMRATDAVETLVEYVDADKDPQLQKVTFKALGEIGDERATQPLANKLVMENENVRPYAARALGLLGDTRAVDPLTDVLADDENDTVRASAAWALRQIGTEKALEAAAEYGDDRSYLVQSESEKASDALSVQQTA